MQKVEALFSERQQKQDQQEAVHVLRPLDDDRMPFLVSSFEELKSIRRYQLYALGFLLLFILSGAALLDAFFLDWLGYEFGCSLR